MRLEEFLDTCDACRLPVTIFDDDAFGDVVLYEGDLFNITDRRILAAEIVGWGVDSTSMEIGVSLR